VNVAQKGSAGRGLTRNKFTSCRCGRCFKLAGGCCWYGSPPVEAEPEDELGARPMRAILCSPVLILPS
jgi:hypothetical protein